MSDWGIGKACSTFGVKRSSATPQVWGGYTDGRQYPEGDLFLFVGQHDSKTRDGKTLVNLLEPKDRNSERARHIAELESGKPGRVLFGSYNAAGKWLSTGMAKPWLIVRVLPVDEMGIRWVEVERLP